MESLFKETEAITIGRFQHGDPAELIQAVVLDDQSRRRFEFLILNLEPGETMRCHIPVYGFRLNLNGRKLSASICFQCNNFAWSEEYPGLIYSFESAGKHAKALLHFFQVRVGDQPSSF